MSKHYSPEADDQMPEKKTSQHRLLLLLLLLVALFAYLYFFTGLIKPREEQIAQAPAPGAAPTDVVKQPLPPRPEGGAAAAPEGATGEEPAKPESAAKPGTPAAAPEGAMAGKPAAPQSAQKQPAPARPAAPATAKPAPAKPAGQGAAAKQEKGKPAQAQGAKTAVAGKAAEGANGAKKGTAAEKSRPAAGKAAATAGKEKAAAGAYALEISDDLLEWEVKSVTAKLKQAGASPVVKTTSQKGEPVHRLYLADFGNRQEALEELERLKTAAPNAFMLKENGRYTVYGGSFVREGRAAVEQERLYEKGVKLLLRSGTATVPVVKLRAGSFADRAKAEKAAQVLKQKGISAKVVKAGK